MTNKFAALLSQAKEIIAKTNRIDLQLKAATAGFDAAVALGSQELMDQHRNALHALLDEGLDLKIEADRLKDSA